MRIDNIIHVNVTYLETNSKSNTVEIYRYTYLPTYYRKLSFGSYCALSIRSINNKYVNRETLTKGI